MNASKSLSNTPIHVLENFSEDRHHFGVYSHSSTVSRESGPILMADFIPPLHCESGPMDFLVNLTTNEWLFFLS